MSVVEKQVIFIMFAMGILGGLGCYIWYRRKRPACDQTTETRPLATTDCGEPMAEQHNAERNDVRKDNLSAKPAEVSLQKTTDITTSPSQTLVKKKARPRHQLSIYLPPNARDEATSKQRHSPTANAHPKRTSVGTSSLPTTPLEKDNQPQAIQLPADVKYIVTVHIPLWLISRFIGRQGCSIKSLTQLSGAQFKIPRHPFTESSHTSCNIIGSTKQIESALGLIHQRFPEVALPRHSNLKLFHEPKRNPIVKEPQHSLNNGITPAKLPSTQFLASVSHINSLSSIWVHIVSSSDKPCPWQVLYEKMNTAYEFASGYSVECGEEDDVEGVPVTKGELYAVRTAEGDFARGLVKEVLSIDNGDTKYRVFLVDFGTHIDVTAERLVSLRYTLNVCSVNIPCIVGNIAWNLAN